MNRRLFLSHLLITSVVANRALAIAQAQTTEPTVEVFRSPTCSCCSAWIEHMQAAGFSVSDTVTTDMAAIKQQYGVPSQLASCHTALVAGYVLEGHVPAADLRRLLAEQPAIAGLAVPGMPIGSPGMEMGDRVDPFTVVAFSQIGETSIYASYP